MIFFKYIFLSISIFCWPMFIMAALAEGTLIKTSTGYKTIETLELNDKVISSSTQNVSKLLNIIHSVAEGVLLITTHKEVIRATKDHIFFDTLLNKWIKAQDLTIGSVLISKNNKTYPCVKIEFIYMTRIPRGF